MDGKVLFPTRVVISAFDVLFIKVLFPILTVTWRENKYVSHPGKGIDKRNENTKKHNLSTASINQSPFCFRTAISLTSFQYDLSIEIKFNLHHCSSFTVENGNSEK